MTPGDGSAAVPSEPRRKAGIGQGPRRFVPDRRAALERGRMALSNAAELAKERGYAEWAETLGGHALALDVALSCECGGTGELPSGWPCLCDLAEQRGVRLPVEEVGPVSEAQVEAGARALRPEAFSGLGVCPMCGGRHSQDRERLEREQARVREQARAVLSAAREVKSDGD